MKLTEATPHKPRTDLASQFHLYARTHVCLLRRIACIHLKEKPTSCTCTCTRVFIEPYDGLSSRALRVFIEPYDGLSSRAFRFQDSTARSSTYMYAHTCVCVSLKEHHTYVCASLKALL